jgi:hypothetical protein
MIPPAFGCKGNLVFSAFALKKSGQPDVRLTALFILASPTGFEPVSPA